PHFAESLASPLARRKHGLERTISVATFTFQSGGRRKIRNYEHATRKIRDRPSRASPRLSLPRCDLRRGPDLLEHRGILAVDSGAHSAAQGPAVLSSARRERRKLLR